MTKRIILSAMVASSLVVAAETDLKKDDVFVTHTEFGYIETRGNTETKTFNLDAKVKKGWDKSIFALTFDGQYSSDKKITTKNKYLIELEYDYEITDRFSFNYLIGYKADKFSAFEYQFYTGPGSKYKAIVSDKHKLSLEGNILYSVDKISGVSKRDEYSAFRAKAIYGWQVLENLKFDQELSYRSSFEKISKYFVFSKSAFTSKLSDIFSAGLSYKVDYVNKAGVKDKTDTTLSANLIIDY